MAPPHDLTHPDPFLAYALAAEHTERRRRAATERLARRAAGRPRRRRAGVR